MHAKQLEDLKKAVELNNFLQKECCIPNGEAGSRLPTAEEIRELLQLKNWSQEDVAILVGVSKETVKKWCLKSESKGNRKIPYAAWALMLVYSGKRIDLDKVNEFVRR